MGVQWTTLHYLGISIGHPLDSTVMLASVTQEGVGSIIPAFNLHSGRDFRSSPALGTNSDAPTGSAEPQMLWRSLGSAQA